MLRLTGWTLRSSLGNDKHKRGGFHCPFSSIRLSKTATGIIIFLAVLFFLSPESSPATGKEVGNVKDRKGSASILRGENTLNARVNESVFKSDTVKTFEKSRIKILFIDDSLLMIGENSNLLVSEYLKGGKKTSYFHLLDGLVNVIVGKKGMEIHTPTALTAARGTSYLLWTEQGKTGMAVTEGQVEIKNLKETVQGKFLVPAGQISYVAKGKPPTTPAITPPGIVKVLYEKTLEDKERWGPVILRAKGSGVPPPKAVNPAQARLMAIRAAKADALRNLLEQAHIVTILSDSTIGDFALKSDLIKSRVDSFIKGAWVSEERKMSDGSYEIDMEIGLGIGFRRMFLE